MVAIGNIATMFNTVNSEHTLVFRASAKLLKNPERWKMFSTVYSVYIHLKVIRVIWVGVVCNLHQRHDWL